MLKEPLTDIFKPRQHFQILDGLRGTAAIAIVVFHFMEFVFSDYSKNFIGHGFLAVDFFFCLSGFVIGYAYDDRIAKMGTREFIKSRLIRLQPLVILGSMLGLVCFLLDPFSTYTHLYSASKVALIFLYSILLIPFPAMPERGYGLFSFNAPSWSLFFEYMANIVYAFVLCRIGRRYLLVLSVIAAIALCWVSYRAGTLIGGWGKDNIGDGCARICYSFLAGLLIYRNNWVIKNKLGFISLSVLLVLSFVMPYFKWNWLAEAFVVIFYLPLLISLGAGAELTVGLKRLCVFLGSISYPLYMTHIALVWVFGNYYSNHKMSTLHLVFAITGGTILLLGVAYIAMVVYDMPVRAYLNDKREKKSKPHY